VDRAAVDAWVRSYVEAWRSNDPQAIGNLFTDDAEYLTGPFDEPWRGRAAIVEGWLARSDEAGSWTFEVSSVDVADGVAFVEGVRSGGRACIYIEHNLAHVHEVADRLVILDRGKVVRTIKKGEISLADLTSQMIALHERGADGSA